MSINVYGSLPDVLNGEIGEAVPAEIGWYLAGLVDGEGCFYIGGGRCEFIIKMRGDERPLLESLRDALGGVGTIRGEVGHTTDRNRKPQVRWQVSAKRQLLWLTELFDVYPLRSKKARDYAIWREAVIALNNGLTGAGLDDYRDRLRAGRVYVPESDRVERPGSQHSDEGLPK